MTSPELELLAERVRTAARGVARSSSAVRDDALRLAADLLDQDWPALVQANESDLAQARAGGLPEAALDERATSRAAAWTRPASCSNSGEVINSGY